MSEESKSAEADYVMMGAPSKRAGVATGIDDPNLSQEDKDHRLAVALQQQENAAAFQEHKQKKEKMVKSHDIRTSRSNTHSRLANIRDKDHGMLSVPASYTTDNAYVKSDGEYLPPLSGYTGPGRNATPQEIADHKLAADLQKFEQVGAGTVREMNEIVTNEAESERAQQKRTERSAYKLP